MPFVDCNLTEVDFTEADLTGAIFRNCDLHLALFDNTILEKADLSSAVNYSINPDNNHIYKAKFAYPAVLNLLDKYQLEIL